jgi:hypothetical protein
MGAWRVIRGPSDRQRENIHGERSLEEQLRLAKAMLGQKNELIRRLEAELREVRARSA